MRTNPPLRLRQSPLVLSLAQVVFTPVLKMESFIPEIQDAFRKAGFPRYEPSTMQQITFAGENPSITVNQRWVFSNKAKTKAVVVSQNFVVLQTSEYDVFDEFCPEFIQALETVTKIAGIEIVERVGLRYVDIVRPRSGEADTLYLAPGLHGIQNDALGVTEATHRYEYVAKTEVGQLVIRLSRHQNQLLPPDLLPADIKLGHAVSPEDKVSILDIDHYRIESMDNDAKALTSLFWQLHDKCDRAFRASTTGHAMSQWEAESIQ